MTPPTKDKKLQRIHFHYTFWAFDEFTESGNMMFPVQLQVMADNESMALGMVKSMVVRKQYELKGVTQCLGNHGEESEI